MGDFKLEGRYKTAWFLGLKFYILKDKDDLKVTLKGINFNDKLNKIDDLPEKKVIKSYFKSKESIFWIWDLFGIWVL